MHTIDFRRFSDHLFFVFQEDDDDGLSSISGQTPTHFMSPVSGFCLFVHG